VIADAPPNAGHATLAALQTSRPGWRVLTQNVDGLHQRAGSRQVIELHGSIWRMRCSACGRREDAVPDHRADDAMPLPRCECGALMRPDVVWFGEALDHDLLSMAWTFVEQADAVLVIGTSAIVYPVAALPDAARARNVPLVEINVEGTPLTTRATHVIRGPAAAALPALERLL
jgi:NAD-dependent deacetylase